MYDPATPGVVFAVFFLAGHVKGIIGPGLPSVSLALLTVIIDLHTAMAIVLLPTFVTKVWQTFAGGNTEVIIKRLWPFLLAACGAVWLGADVAPGPSIAVLRAIESCKTA